MNDYVQNNIPTSVTGFVNDLYYAKSKLLEANTEAEKRRGAIGKLCLQSGCDIYIKGVTANHYFVIDCADKCRSGQSI